jgi:hypothetical protein
MSKTEEHYMDRYARKLAQMRIRDELREAHDELPDTFLPGAPLPARIRGALAVLAAKVAAAERKNKMTQDEADDYARQANPGWLGGR